MYTERGKRQRPGTGVINKMQRFIYNDIQIPITMTELLHVSEDGGIPGI